MKYIYLGGFPPPFGGVTVKNKLLFKRLSNYIEIKQSGFYKRNKSIILRVISLIIELFSRRKGLIIGVSKDSLKILTYILYYINRKTMKKSIVMVMGGTFHQMVMGDNKLQKFLLEYKHIYTETYIMKRALNSVGISNVSVFPNSRERTNISLSFLSESQRIRCLFFSKISTEKGVDNILYMTKILENKGIKYSVDFYGEIISEYKMDFEAALDMNNNLHYHGIFNAVDSNELYKKLNSYDVLLFPTKWKNEGVPGVLIEAKIAGLPSIVSDINFNSEIIENNRTGIVLKQNSPMELANAIEKLYTDRELLVKMKQNAKVSSENFIIDNYIEDIVSCLKQPIK